LQASARNRCYNAEYVYIACAFYGRKESGMINAVLDALARERRPAEFPARARSLGGRIHVDGAK